MPQLDQDHLVCAGARGLGESKGEPAAPALPAAGAVQRGGDVSASAGVRDGDDDTPAGSVLLRVQDGIGLAGLFGAALRRDGSTKGSSNPKAAAEAEAATRKQGAPRAADSRRLSASKTAVVIGVLPAAGKVVAKERRAPGRVVAARAWRRPAGGARVFASEAVGTEPVSPKVSCFGAVLPVPETPAAAPPGPGKQEEEEERGGCWASVPASLRGLCCNCNSDPREDESGASASNSKATTAPEPPPAAVLSPPRPVAGLGDVKRLASRRWPETMAAAEGRGSV